SMTLGVRRLGPTAQVLTELMGFRQRDEYLTPGDQGRRVLVFEVGGGGPGTELHVEERDDLPPARLGSGGVHHVAFRTPNDEEHAAWQRRLASAGERVTPVIDRFYFKVISFRRPGGDLLLAATPGPGFTPIQGPTPPGEHPSPP